jgi:hypothetical protein
MLGESQKLKDRNEEGEADRRAGNHADESLTGPTPEDHINDQAKNGKSDDERCEFEKAFWVAKYREPP